MDSISASLTRLVSPYQTCISSNGSYWPFAKPKLCKSHLIKQTGISAGKMSDKFLGYRPMSGKVHGKLIPWDQIPWCLCYFYIQNIVLGLFTAQNYVICIGTIGIYH